MLEPTPIIILVGQFWLGDQQTSGEVFLLKELVDNLITYSSRFLVGATPTLPGCLMKYPGAYLPKNDGFSGRSESDVI